MSPTTKQKRTSDIRVSDSKSNNATFLEICEVLVNYRIFVPLEKERKHSTTSGWNKRANLIPKEDGYNHLRKGGNVGLILGESFNDTTYILFDVEKEGILPEDLKSVIDTHTLVSFRSPHNGFNRIAKIEEEAYELLDGYDTTITDITDNNKEDIEFIMSGASPLPPTEISHTYCSDSKPCSGEGKDRYTTVEINPEAPTLDIEAVELIGGLLDLQEEEAPNYPDNVDGNVPSPTPKFNIEKEFNENVPSVEHTFEERYDYMMFGDWKGQGVFQELYNGNFGSVSGSNKQGKAECKLANYIGFFFGNNEKMVRLFMSQVNFDSHYKKYESHREFLLENATKVDNCYCEEVTLETRLVVATQIFIYKRVSKKELIEASSLSHDTIQRVIPILKAENVVEETTEKKEKVYINSGITEGYLETLDTVADNKQEEYEDSNSIVQIERTKI